MTSEIKALSQINPRRNVKQSTPSSSQMVNPINGGSKRSGVQSAAIADSPKIGNGDLVVAVLHGDYAGAGGEVGGEWGGEKGGGGDENEEEKRRHLGEMGKRTRRKICGDALWEERDVDLGVKTRGKIQEGIEIEKKKRFGDC